MAGHDASSTTSASAGSRRRRWRRGRRGEDRGRWQRPGARANRSPRSPPAAEPCTRRKASAWAAPRWPPGRRPSPSCCSVASPRPRIILDGVDTTWNRVPGWRRDRTIDRGRDRAIQPGRPGGQRARVAGDPQPSCPRCPRTPSSATSASSWTGSSRPASVSRWRRWWIDAEVVPGETLKMRHTAVVRSRVPVRWTAVRYPSIRRAVTKVPRPARRTSRSSVTRPRSCPPPRRRASRTGCARKARPACFTSMILRSSAARRTRPCSRSSTSSTSAARRS